MTCYQQQLRPTKCHGHLSRLFYFGLRKKKKKKSKREKGGHSAIVCHYSLTIVQPSAIVCHGEVLLLVTIRQCY